jgi:hypothetical protein
VVLGFELRALHLLSRHSTILSHLTGLSFVLKYWALCVCAACIPDSCACMWWEKAKTSQHVSRNTELQSPAEEDLREGVLVGVLYHPLLVGQLNLCSTGFALANPAQRHVPLYILGIWSHHPRWA